MIPIGGQFWNDFGVKLRRGVKAPSRMQRVNTSIYEFYFDPKYYEAAYPEDAEYCKSKNISLLEFFVKFGREKGRNPSKYFDTSWYLSNASDISRDAEPLSHYVRSGWRMGLSPHEGFNVVYYLARYEDVRRAGVEPMRHFLQHGQFEGRRAHP